MNHFHEDGIPDCEIYAKSVEVLMARLERWISMEVELGVSPRCELDFRASFVPSTALRCKVSYYWRRNLGPRHVDFHLSIYEVSESTGFNSIHRSSR